MTPKLSTTPLQMRWFAIILGIVFLFWLPFEDSSTIPILLFSIMLSILGAGIYLSNSLKPFRTVLSNHILAGTVAGLAITPIALILIAIKTGLHAHQTPDFSNQDILSVVYRTPIWLIGGFLIGLGSGIRSTYHKP